MAYTCDLGLLRYVERVATEHNARPNYTLPEMTSVGQRAPAHMLRELFMAVQEASADPVLGARLGAIGEVD